MGTFLDYTKLTYNEIVQEVQAKMASDPRFGSFKESAIAQTLIEIFAATSDLNNYYIERRAEESYLETAKLRSSIIQLAKQIGYIITRPIPATTSISMTITGGGNLGNFLNGVAVDSVNYIELGVLKPFTFNGINFLLRRAYKYIFTEADIVNFKNATYSKTISLGLLNTDVLYNLYKDEDLINIADTVTIDLIQGDLEYYDIASNLNDQINNKFQVYKIDDATYSNFYGSEDLDIKLSRVAVNSSVQNPFKYGDTVLNEYTIDRKSLLKQGEDLLTFGTADNTCLIRTAIDDTIELVFGDGNYSSIGAQTGDKNNIYVQYLSTKGAGSNQVGVVGQKITTSEPIYIMNGSTSQDISSNISFLLTKNITGGADIEDIESIKILAPKIYSSLDRCVTKDDYAAFLKTLTSPINVKNSIAWGEQEERQNAVPDDTFADFAKLFNLVLFSVIGELYRYDSVRKSWEVKESDTSDVGELGNAVLDNVDLYTQFSENSYFNLLVKEDSPGVSRTLQAANIADPLSKIGQVYTQLSNKSQMTVRNVYVSPIIHDFEITGSVYVSRLSDSAQVLTNIKNELYPYINTQADFDKPLYMGNVTQLIENVSNVQYTNLNIKWDTNTQTIFGTEIVTGTESASDAISNDPDALAWCSSYGPSISGSIMDNLKSAFSKTFIPYLQTSTNGLVYYKTKDNFVVDDGNDTPIDEKWFNKVFLKSLNMKLRTYLGSYYDSFYSTGYYGNIIVKLHNTLVYAINYNLLTGDNKQDITNYSLGNEIAKIKFNANVFYSQN